LNYNVTMPLDKIDKIIIESFKRNGRTPYSAIAQEVGLSATSIGQRVQKLMDDKVIKGFDVKLDHEKLGINLEAFITVVLHFAKIEAFKKALDSFDEVQSCYRVTGEDCVILKVNLNNKKHLVEFLDKLSDYGSSQTRIIIEQLA